MDFYLGFQQNLWYSKKVKKLHSIPNEAIPNNAGKDTYTVLVEVIFMNLT
jgi:hypothetical protein